MIVPVCRNFKLIAPIDNVPAGATGQLKRPDSFHVSLIFDDYEDLVFDVYDTETAVWLLALEYISNPSMTDPPRKVLTWRQAAMAAAIVVATLGVDIFFDSYTHTVANAANALPQLINEYLFAD